MLPDRTVDRLRPLWERHLAAILIETGRLSHGGMRLRPTESNS
jgi:hypothetical protein